jgi:hypothetical protein
MDRGVRSLLLHCTLFGMKISMKYKFLGFGRKGAESLTLLSAVSIKEEYGKPIMAPSVKSLN